MTFPESERVIPAGQRCGGSRRGRTGRTVAALNMKAQGVLGDSRERVWCRRGPEPGDRQDYMTSPAAT